MTGTVAFITVKAVDKASKSLRGTAVSIDRLAKAQAKQIVKTKEANKAGKKAKTSTDKLKTSLRNLSSSIAVVDGPLGGVASRFNALGTIVGRVNKNLIKATVAFIAFSAAARLGLKAFGDFEQLTLRLEAVLENTGRRGAASLEKLTAAAQELAIATLASEEGALEAVTAIASFEDIPDSKIIEILNLSQDLSVLFGGDLKQNALLLGRAFNDVEGAAEFLRRKGLKLDKQQKDYIITLVAQGKILKAITFLQDKLSNIQGIAIKEADSLKGVYDSLGVTLRITARNFAEYSGSVAVAKGAGIALTSVLRVMADNMKILSTSITVLALVSLPALVKGLNALLTTGILFFLNRSAKGFTVTKLKVNALSFAFTALTANILRSAKAFIATPFGKIILLILGVVKALDALSKIQIQTAEGAVRLGEVAVFGFKKIGTAIVEGPIKSMKEWIEAQSDLIDTVAGFISKTIDEFSLMAINIVKIFRIMFVRVIEVFKKSVPIIAGILDNIPLIEKLIDGGKVKANIKGIEAESSAAIAKIEGDARKAGQAIAELGTGGVLAEIAASTAPVKFFKDLAAEAAAAKKAAEVAGVAKGPTGRSAAEQEILDSLVKQLDIAKDQVAVNRILLSGAEKSAQIAALIVERNKAQSQAAKDVLTQIIAVTREEERLGELLKGRKGGADRLKKILEETEALKDQLAVTNLLITGQEKSAAAAALTVQIMKETDPLLRKILEINRDLTIKLEEQNEVLKRQEKEWKSVNSAVKDTFKGIITGADSVQEALAGLLAKLSEIALESAFADFSLRNIGGGGGGGPFDFLGKIPSLLFNAQGNAFQNGQHLQKFAHGDIFDRPTFFPMRGNNIGELGEAGPEAILPLTRTAGGDLGVKSIGGASGGNNITMQVGVEVNVSSNGQENLSNPEEARRMGNLISQSVETKVLEVIDRESRSGGRLSPNTPNRGSI